MNIRIIERLESRLSEKQCQWVWFIGLWAFGLLSVGTLAYAIRLVMGIE